MRSILVMMLTFLSCSGAPGQVVLGAIDADSLLGVMVEVGGYDFVDLESDTITHYGEPLGRVALSDQGLYTVVHYGDSHLQGGVLPDIVRHGLQSHFGNAGPGMLTPYALSGSGYEPLWYDITSAQRWRGERITSRAAAFSLGVTGVSLRYSNMSGGRQDLMVCTKDQNLWRAVCAESQGRIESAESFDFQVDNSFNTIRVFHDSLAPQIALADPNLLMHPIGLGDSPAEAQYTYTTPIYLKNPTHQILLATYPQGPYNSQNGGISGISLENGKPGLLYHALGISGACALHWGRSEGSFAQSQALGANLIIISLGSNEAAGNNFIPEVFIQQLDRLVEQATKANPQAKILIITPVQVFKRTSKGPRPNPNYRLLASAAHQYAKDKQLSILDLYAATGANNGAQNCLQHNLLRPDKLHFTQQGYQLQALLILRALLRGA